MESIEIQEPGSAAATAAKTPPPKKNGFVHRRKRLLVTVIVAFLLAVVIAIVVAVVVTGNNKRAEEKRRRTTVPASTSTSIASTTTTIDRPDSRMDCLPWLKNKPNASLVIQSECSKQVDCKYQPTSDENAPACYYDTDSLKLSVLEINETDLGRSYIVIPKSKKQTTDAIKVNFEYLEDHVLRIEITKPTQQEYHVPIHPNRPVDKIKAKNPLYEVVVNENESEFSFQIKRISTQTIIWDTSIGAIIYENLNRQIATKLPSTNVYGFGENKHESFRHDFNYKNWPIFNRDEAPENVPQGNLYGTQPFYTCLEPYGKSHGVALVNSNAMEYEFVPNPGLIYRTTGGVFDFYVFLGPEPENVVQQFTQYFGRPFLPPYWALGFSISRYGYKNLEDMKGVLTRFENNNLPLDVQVADIDHFDKRADFTIDQENWAGLPDYFNELHEKGMKTVLILDPAIPIERGETYWPYENGVTNDVFIKWDNGTTMFAACWPPGPVAYPDFFKKSTQEWWINSILQHHQTLKFDGIWIDMNDPSAFGTNELKPFNWPEDREPWSLKCPDDEYELVKTKASYVHKDENKLSDKTLCMSGLQGENNEYKHFDVHNLFGHVQLQPTYEAAKKIQNDDNNKRGLVYSRSTFLGSGQYGGHWTGDNHSRWSNLYYSIIGMLEFNLFGIPYVGADICGFFEDTTVELCARWSSLGAFYPFSRNHNGENNIDQDPGALGEEVVRAAKNALEIRYEILPYYYTLFYKSHVHGNTVARPLFHEFSRDSRTYSIDRQFLIGPAFLVTPVLEENVTSVEGYFPQSHWFDYYTGKLIVKQDDNGKFLELDSPLDHIPLHIRGGYILPTQNHGLTTTASRQNPFGLIVAPDNYGEAKGDLFYDDGETDVSLGQFFYATFNLRENILRMYVEKNNYGEMENKVLDKIRIFVAKSNSKLTFILNKDEIISDDKITFGDNEIVLNDLNIPMSKSFEIEWTSEYYLPVGSLGPIIDCSPDGSINETECTDKGCMYYAAYTFDYIPRCFVHESKGGYIVQATNANEIELVRGDSTLNIVKEGAIENVRLTISHGSIADKFGLTRIKFEDRDKSRYQVPVQLHYAETQTAFLNVNVTNSRASNRAQISVKNSDGSKTLFDNVEVEHGLAFYDQFLQIVLNLRDYKNLYGMGENTHYSFKHRFAYSSWWGVFGRDQPPGGRYINLYGSHPFFMAVDETTGRAFGALILNSNAQEYGLLPPSSISYRSVGGILDIYVMEEASPELLIQAYTTLIGKPFMPPYWALGFQLSRYGYNIIERLQDAVNRTLNAKIPLDVQYADIDHFHRQLDFTYDIDKFRGLPDYIQELRQKGVRFIIILDPAINSEATDYAPFKNGIDADAYIKWPEDENPQLNEFGDNNNPYLLGYVWPEGKTVFPDFFRESAKNWWINEIKEYYHNTLKFDGLWIDMNEPANFGTNEEKPWNWPAERPPWSLKCPNNNYDDPPYLPLVARPYGNRVRISDKTICMRARQGESDQEYTHYDVHNMFGWSQSEPTQRALLELLNERSVVISRSTYVSSGTHAGHWLGDNNSSWDHLKFNIIGLLEFNLFGIPYIGADICGYFSDTTPEMCTRWMQLGAFNTFFRNHNGMGYIDQDPAALGVDVAASSRSAVELRYTLLPFLYTLFYNAHLNGGTVIRSLMHEFPQDVRALDIDRQFMWGSSLLISPVLDPNTRSVFAYFPKEARWFDYYTGVEIESGRAHEIDAPLDFIPLHVRGGSIIVTQDSAMNTDLSRTNPFRLLIAPGQENAEYKFELFYDNGVNLELEQASHIEFSYIFDGTSHKINISPGPVFNYEFHANNTLNEIRIFGVKNAPNSMVLDGNGEISTFEFRSDTNVLTIYNLGIKFEKDNSYSLTVN